jgi:hypothetical protein
LAACVPEPHQYPAGQGFWLPDCAPVPHQYPARQFRQALIDVLPRLGLNLPWSVFEKKAKGCKNEKRWCVEGGD